MAVFLTTTNTCYPSWVGERNKIFFLVAGVGDTDVLRVNLYQDIDTVNFIDN